MLLTRLSDLFWSMIIRGLAAAVAALSSLASSADKINRSNLWPKSFYFTKHDLLLAFAQVSCLWRFWSFPRFPKRYNSRTNRKTCLLLALNLGPQQLLSILSRFTTCLTGRGREILCSIITFIISFFPLLNERVVDEVSFSIHLLLLFFVLSSLTLFHTHTPSKNSANQPAWWSPTATTTVFSFEWHQRVWLARHSTETDSFSLTLDATSNQTQSVIVRPPRNCVIEVADWRDVHVVTTCWGEEASGIVGRQETKIKIRAIYKQQQQQQQWVSSPNKKVLWPCSASIY